MAAKTLLVNCQGTFRIPADYVWVARNQTGIMNGFMNPPIRDYKTGEWQDSVNGSYGFFIPFEGWETSIRKVAELNDAYEVRARTIRNKQSVKKEVDNGSNEGKD